MGRMDKNGERHIYGYRLNLRQVGELSYEEIADRLQIPMGSVKGKLFRAKDMLQAIMKEEILYN